MFSFLRYFCILFLFALLTSSAFSQPHFAVKDPESNAVLMRLFDAQSIDTDGALVWKPNFSESNDFEGNICDDGFCHTQFDTAMYYSISLGTLGHDSCVLLVFSTSNGDDCHGCTPTISLATFKKLDSLWYFDRMSKNFTQFGAFGYGPDVSLTGPNNDILELETTNSGQGMSFDNVVYYEIYSYAQIYCGTIDCDNDDADEPHYHYTREITFINPKRESETGYYDIKIIEKGTRPINGFGSKVHRVSSTQILRWNEDSNCYFPLK